MRIASRKVGLAVVLGMATAVAVAWITAAATKPPMYPRQSVGGFVRWNRPYTTHEAYRFGLVQVWWGDRTLPANSADGTLSAEQVVAQLVAEIHEIMGDPARSPAGAPVVLRNTPRPWGTFTARQPPPIEYPSGTDAAFGWPLPCLWYRVLSQRGNNGALYGSMLEGGVTLFGRPASRWDGYRVLPLRPYLLGLAGNTAVYAAAWALLLYVPPALRRRLRLRRGHCISCGYDLRGDYTRTCPECGLVSGPAAEARD